MVDREGPVVRSAAIGNRNSSRPFWARICAGILCDLDGAVRPATKHLAAVCAILFALPFILCFALDAGFLDIANEPLAYRFFFPERIQQGEAIVVGVGYLVSLLHHAVYAFLHLMPSMAAESLERRLDLFALTTNGTLTFLLCTILFVAARSPSLKAGDVVLLALTALLPIYATLGMGFNYSLMADYHFLNIVLCAASLLLFQIYWRGAGEKSTLAEVFLLGVFVGTAASNKITMLSVAGLVLVPVMCLKAMTRRELVLRASTAVAGLLTAFLAVHLAAYLGNVRLAKSALKIWWGFLSSAGAEPAFWKDLFLAYFHAYGYDYLIAYSSIAVVAAITVAVIGRSLDLRMGCVIAYCVAGLALASFFLFKRPAGSTLFESVMFALTFASALLSVTLNHRLIRSLVAASLAFWIAYIPFTFAAKAHYGTIAGSKERSRPKWQVFEEARRQSDGYPMEVIFPDNSFHHEGVFELLLKAAADFPTWYIRGGQRTVLDRYAPGMTFRHHYGGKDPGAPYESGRTLVWFDRKDLSPLAVQYPSLADAVSRPGVMRQQWPVATGGGGVYLTMHLAIIPPEK